MPILKKRQKAQARKTIRRMLIKDPHEKKKVETQRAVDKLETIARSSEDPKERWSALMEIFAMMDDLCFEMQGIEDAINRASKSLRKLNKGSNEQKNVMRVRLQELRESLKRKQELEDTCTFALERLACCKHEEIRNRAFSAVSYNSVAIKIIYFACPHNDIKRRARDLAPGESDRYFSAIGAWLPDEDKKPKAAGQ